MNKETNKPLTEEEVIIPFVQEVYTDNGAISHYRLIDQNTGELLWSGFPEEDEILYTGYKAPISIEKCLEIAREAFKAGRNFMIGKLNEDLMDGNKEPDEVLYITALKDKI